MTTASLDGPRLKLRRARKHLEDLERLMGSFIEAETKRVAVEHDPQTGARLWVLHQPGKPDPAWGTIIGDVLYNLRSALDHLAWQLVLANGKNPNTMDAGFPIFESVESYATKGLAQVRGMSERVRTEMEAAQPYHRPSTTWRTDDLLLLNRLNNVYKHRHFKLTLLQVTGGGGWGLPDGMQFGVPADMEGRAVFAVWPHPKPEVQVNYTPDLDIVFADSPWGDERVIETLTRLANTVEATIRYIGEIAELA